MSGQLHDTYFGHRHRTVIEQSRGWRMLDMQELWAYRELLGVLAMRDVKVRYKQTVLGVIWVILQPLMTMTMFTLIFGKLARMPSDGYPYAVFVYSALLPWGFFAGAINASGNSLVGSAGLISKVYFPRLIVPLASVGAGLVDLAVSTAVLLVLLPCFGVTFTLNLLAAPLLLLAVILTALGVGTFFSALTVAYRDFRNLVSFMVQIWMYATPVVYPSSLIPEKWRWLLHLNPMTGLVEGFRSVFLGKPFDFASIGVSFVISIILFAVGVAYFEKVERRFADII